MTQPNLLNEDDLLTTSETTALEGYHQLALPLEYGSLPQNTSNPMDKSGHRFLLPSLKLKPLGQAGLLLLVLGVAIAWTRQQDIFATAPATAVATQVNALAVEAIELEPSDSFVITQQYTGQVAALRTSELGFEQGGTLVWVGVDRGDRVTQGTPLARLDTRNLEAQRSQLEAQRDQAVAVLTELQRGPRQEDIDAAAATVRDLENQLELQRIRQLRRQYLVDEGAIAPEELDEVAFGANALAERLASARSQLAELETGTRSEQIMAQAAVVQQLNAQIVNMDVTIAKSTILAPFDGLIGERQQDEGTVVGASQPVVRLVESAQPEVEIGIPSNRLAALPQGSRHPVDIGGDRYTATVQTVLPELDPTTRTRTVIFQLNDVSLTGATLIAPSQIARLSLATTIEESGYWLPVTALTQGEKGLWTTYALVPMSSELMLAEPIASESIASESIASESIASEPSPVDSSYQVERRLVEILHTEGDRVFVRGTLSPGDLVISDSTQKVVPGQQVQPML